MILTLSVHYSRISDIIVPDHLVTAPAVPITAYRDSYGNWCSRIVAPQGLLKLSADGVVRDTGQPQSVARSPGPCPSFLPLFLEGGELVQRAAKRLDGKATARRAGSPSNETQRSPPSGPARPRTVDDAPCRQQQGLPFIEECVI